MGRGSPGRGVIRPLDSDGAVPPPRPLGARGVLTGAAERAWAAIHRFLPQGVATPPGEAFFVTTVALQRLAVALSLAAGELPTAHAWLAAHDRWLAWGEIVLWQSEGQALWAQY